MHGPSTARKSSIQPRSLAVAGPVLNTRLVGWLMPFVASEYRHMQHLTYRVSEGDTLLPGDIKNIEFRFGTGYD